MIRITGLSKRFGETVALDDVSLEVREGRITGLLGLNGAGKTTLLSILSGVLRKDRGKLIVHGLDLDVDSRGIRKISAAVPQSLAYYPTLTCRENLRFFGAVRGLRGRSLRRAVAFATEACGLEEVSNRRAASYSGGMQRRLNLAIGLMGDCEVLYLDEPTVGVDVRSRRAILDMIRRIARERNTTIVYTSHYVEEVEAIAADVIVIHRGRIAVSGALSDLLAGDSDLVVRIDGDAEPARRILLAVPGSRQQGDEILVPGGDRLFESGRVVFAALERSGGRLRGLHMERRSLEEVFLKVTGAADHDADPILAPLGAAAASSAAPAPRRE